jgi:hypothetical protein
MEGSGSSRERPKGKCNRPKYFFLYCQAPLNFHFITLVPLMSFTKNFYLNLIEINRANYHNLLINYLGYYSMDGDLSVCLYAENKIYVCTVQPQSGVVYF